MKAPDYDFVMHIWTNAPYNNAYCEALYYDMWQTKSPFAIFHSWLTSWWVPKLITHHNCIFVCPSWRHYGTPHWSWAHMKLSTLWLNSSSNQSNISIWANYTKKKKCNLPQLSSCVTHHYCTSLQPHCCLNIHVPCSFLLHSVSLYHRMKHQSIQLAVVQRLQSLQLTTMVPAVLYRKCLTCVCENNGDVSCGGTETNIPTSWSLLNVTGPGVLAQKLHGTLFVLILWCFMTNIKQQCGWSDVQ